MTWLVRGAVAWHTDSLGEKPEPLQAAQRAYVEENDQMTDFLRQHCRKVVGGRVDTTDLREAFQVAYDVRMSAVNFKKSMAARGFSISRQRLPVTPSCTKYLKTCNCYSSVHYVHFENIQLLTY